MASLARFLCRTLAALALAPLGRTQSPAGNTSEDEAAQELARIEEAFEKGQYAKAHGAYEKLAEEFAGTAAGRLAARRSRPNAVLGSRDLVRTGPSANRVDVVFMGDGYTLQKLNSFDDFAKAVLPAFEHDRVFGEYLSYLNFIASVVVSEEEGVDAFGREANTALGTHVQPGRAVDHVWADVGLVRAALEDTSENDGYAIVFQPIGGVGSGGADVAVVGSRNPVSVLHEWGHAFAQLKDEYSTDTIDRGEVSSWINVSESEDPATVPWKHWLDAKVPGIGVYEGADGRVRGAFKPTASGCVMEEGETYCPVCREAIVLRIYQHVDPIESARVVPAEKASEKAPVEASAERAAELPATDLTGEEPHRFEVHTLEPKEHALEVNWFVLPESEAPPPGGDPTLRPRVRRGALAPIDAKPAHRSRSKDGRHVFDVAPKELEPGRYRVLVRVRDTTELRGDRFPWVLLDEHGLLESERGWWVVVEDARDG
jgi:hypothetical protein